MSYGVKCPTCGLMQIPRPACKACGAVLPGPPELPKARPRVASEDHAPARVITRTTGTTDGMGTTERVGTPGMAEAIQTPMAAEPTGPRGIPPENICSQCGLVFRTDELIKFGDRRVCAGCKPLYVQRVREGLVPVGEMVYAGFWTRFAAKLVDGLIVSFSFIIVTVAFVTLFRVKGPPTRMGVFVPGIVQILIYGVYFAFETYFLGRFGATPGKMACGLKVVRPDGEKISYGRAFGRTLASLLSGMIIYIGYIIAAFDEERRTLHDRICDTRVVKA